MFVITFQPQELELIGKILAEHPFKVVAPLIDNINKQVQDQLKHDETRANA